MSDDSEWLSLVILAEIEVSVLTINHLMMHGNAAPDRVAKTLRNLHRQMLKKGEPSSAAATSLEVLRKGLFGEDDRRLRRRG